MSARRSEAMAKFFSANQIAHAFPACLFLPLSISTTAVTVVAPIATTAPPAIFLFHTSA